MSKRFFRIVQIIALSVVIIAVLMTLQIIIQMKNNKDRADNAAGVLMNQVEGVIADNIQEIQRLTVEAKDMCINKAMIVSAILDLKKSAVSDVNELIKIAELVQVDEIHLFDTSGKIISGTVPEYYGYTFDSGEQIRYFKPMLENKDRRMCQDLVPNTAEGKTMMYAIVWRSDGSGMVQIGIVPIQHIDYLRANEISFVIDNMLTYDGMDIIVADRKSARISGSTIARFIYQDLDSIGIDVLRMQTDKINHFITDIAGRKSYCALHEYDKYYIVIIQDYNRVNQTVVFTAFIVFIYLLLATILIVHIVRRMTSRIIAEKERANRDKMTGLLNRQAYENAVTEQAKSEPPENDFVFLMADLNGLKITNDTLGHGAGDELLHGAAECLNRCFGAYGNIYRIGGDEFVAMIYADTDVLSKLQKGLNESLKKWTGTLVSDLSLSCGYVEKREFPNMTLGEIIRVADNRMYMAKKEYYSCCGTDCHR